jgi:hypothetical protein
MLIKHGLVAFLHLMAPEPTHFGFWVGHTNVISVSPSFQNLIGEERGLSSQLAQASGQPGNSATSSSFLPPHVWLTFTRSSSRMPAVMSGQSIYTSGALNDRQIRLLYVHPAIDHHQDLVCSCYSFDIEEAPAYEALSYVWGPLKQPHDVLCNGQAIEIWQSLYAALKRLRLPDSDRIIWTDAICINQRDNAEKSHQVPLMGSIYSKAKKVVVWLGPGTPQETQTAFETLRCVARACYQYNRENGIDDKDYLKMHETVRVPQEIFTPSALTSLMELFTKPWFHRTWCIQEIRLAQDALVLWGHDEITWQEFAISTSWMFDNTTEKVDGLDTPLSQLCNSNGVTHATLLGEKSTDTLLSTLQRFREFEASEPKDKVYGLLNLISPESERDIIDVDYDKSVGQVYADTVLNIVRLYSRLSTFAYVTHLEHYAGEESGDTEEYDKEQDDYDETYRSWAPLWDDLTCARVLGEPHKDCPWRPGGPATVLPPEIYDLSADDLCLRGISFENVRKVEDVMDFYYLRNLTTTEWLQPILEIFTNILEDADLSESSWLRQWCQWRLLSLARTMTAGSWRTPDKYLQDLDLETQSRYYMAYINFMCRAILLRETGEEGNFRHDADSKQFEDLTFDTCSMRRMFWTEHDYLGLGPQCMRAGDIVAVLHGGNTPYVLRPRGDKYLFMGSAYVDVIMNGQLMERLSRGEVQEQDFYLI